MPLSISLSGSNVTYFHSYYNSYQYNLQTLNNYNRTHVVLWHTY